MTAPVSFGEYLWSPVATFSTRKAASCCAIATACADDGDCPSTETCATTACTELTAATACPAGTECLVAEGVCTSTVPACPDGEYCPEGEASVPFVAGEEPVWTQLALGPQAGTWVRSGKKPCLPGFKCNSGLREDL